MEFSVEVPDVEELSEGAPRALVVQNALLKLRAVPGERVLAVDSMVVWDGRAHGKPSDDAEAERWLRELSGRWHEVMGGIALREGGEERTGLAVTRVRFRELSKADMERYLASDEWRDRPAATRSRSSAPCWSRKSRATTSTWWGLPVPALLRLHAVAVAAIVGVLGSS